MKSLKIASAIAAAFSSLSLAFPSHAAIQGYLDCVYISSADLLFGWVCEGSDPSNTPSYGKLAFFVNDNYHSEINLVSGSTWGTYYDGVNQAGYCGSHPNVGFGIGLFLGLSSGDRVKVKFKDNGGNYHTLYGNGEVTINTIPGENGNCPPWSGY